MGELILGDCLEVMAGLPDEFVDLIATDPPYFRVKGHYWDNQWDNSAKFLEWIDKLCQEWARLLKPNGSLYVFASPDMSLGVAYTISKHFSILNRIRWVKEAGWHKRSRKEELRSYLSPWEEIIFSEHKEYSLLEKGYTGKLFEPLMQYLEGERKRAGVSRAACNTACGVRTMAGNHYFCLSQWSLPTEEHYLALRQLFNTAGGSYLQMEYRELKDKYDALRRAFHSSSTSPYSDIWESFPVVQPYPGKHPCEKPLDLMSHIISISSREGDTVLDSFMGTGSTGEAAIKLGREFIGIEKDPDYFNRAQSRLKAVSSVQAVSIFPPETVP